MERIPEDEIPTKLEGPSKKELIARLSHYLNDYADEIPTERVNGQRTHKVNGSWLQAAFSNMRYTLDNFLDDTKLKEEVNSFFKTVHARRNAALQAMLRDEQPDSFVPTTKEEINTMNTLLRKVIESLQRSIITVDE